jgi:hypothetical protein
MCGSAPKRTIPLVSQGSASSSSEQSAHYRALTDGVCARSGCCALPKALPEAIPADPDLAAVIDAWDRLPAALKAGIVAMVKAAAAGGR